MLCYTWTSKKQILPLEQFQSWQFLRKHFPCFTGCWGHGVIRGISVASLPSNFLFFFNQKKQTTGCQNPRRANLVNPSIPEAEIWIIHCGFSLCSFVFKCPPLWFRVGAIHIMHRYMEAVPLCSSPSQLHICATIPLAKTSQAIKIWW